MPYSLLKKLHTFKISDSCATPEGSIIILSGENSSIIALIDSLKSVTRLQHIHPEFISLTGMFPCISFLSSPIFPNSFSIITVFPLFPDIYLFMNVVFPAPRNPEIICIIISPVFLQF